MKGTALGVVDQALASASNAFFVFAVARASDTLSFGLFAFVYVGLTTSIALGRGVLGSMVTIRADSPLRLATEGRYALASALLLGGALTAVFSVPALILAPLSAALLVLALPVVLAQDLSRVVAIAQNRPKFAVASDGLWFAVSLALLVGSWFRPGQMRPTTTTAVWIAGGVASLLVLVVGLRLRPALSGLRRWAGQEIGHRLRFAADASISSAVALAVTASATALIGPAAAAALRGAGTILGPLNILLVSLQLAIVPALRRSGDLDTRALQRRVMPVGAIVAVLAIGVGVLGLLLPEDKGALLLGSSWMAAAAVLPIFALEYLGQAWLATSTTVLRAQLRTQALLRLRILMATSALALTLASAALWRTAEAAAAGSLCAAWLTAASAAVLLRRRDPGRLR